MHVDAFLAELDAQVKGALARIEAGARGGEPGPELTVAKLLVVALRNELEAAEEAALWITQERDVEVKLALARQCGDEARHYRLIAERLGALGVDAGKIDPTAQGPTKMFEYLQGLGTTVERVAAGQFTREALAGVRNQVFIELCEARGDAETARLYRDVIQPDEAHHHQLGRKLLARLATSPEAQDLARRAAARTLEVAEELQELARLKAGITRAPGC